MSVSLHALFYPRLPRQAHSGSFISYSATTVLIYVSTMVDGPHGNPDELIIERVQTGVRMEKRLLKVLKALADLHDITLGDLLEGIVLHAFEGKSPFNERSLAQIAELKNVFGLTLDASASHRLRERNNDRR
jgi:hypothetical protein